MSPPPPPPPPKITHVCEDVNDDDVDSSLGGSVEQSELPLPRVARADTETPFDSKGRCHQHRDVQLASKRMGAWKVILDSCPRCESENSGAKLSDKSKFSAESGKSMTFENTVVHFDSSGCCVNHPSIKIAKKKVLGRWKVRIPVIFPSTFKFERFNIFLFYEFILIIHDNNTGYASLSLMRQQRRPRIRINQRIT